MDPKLYAEEFASGDLPDDEDSRPDLVIDEDDDYAFSGSGDRGSSCSEWALLQGRTAFCMYKSVALLPELVVNRSC